jgi:hypothetical protein
MTLTSHASSKEAREREAFEQFSRRLGNREAWLSIQSRPTPEPDLLCEHQTDGFVAFELVAITDPQLAELSALGPDANRTSLWTEDPTEMILRKKLSRSYRTSHSIELLVYTDSLVISTDDMIVPAIQLIADAGSHPFKRIWFMGEETTKCIWPKP